MCMHSMHEWIGALCVLQVNTEIAAAKKEYCAQAGADAKNFCATSVPAAASPFAKQ